MRLIFPSQDSPCLTETLPERWFLFYFRGIRDWKYRYTFPSFQSTIPLSIFFRPSRKRFCLVLKWRIFQSLIWCYFPATPCRFHDFYFRIRNFHICSDYSSIQPLITIDRPVSPCRIDPISAKLRHFTMSDHHIKRTPILHWPFVLISHRRIHMISFFLRNLEAEKWRSYSSREIFDHTYAELVSRFFMDSRLYKPLSHEGITESDPLRVVGIYDEFSFDFEVGSHIDEVMSKYNP